MAISNTLMTVMNFRETLDMVFRLSLLSDKPDATQKDNNSHSAHHGRYHLSRKQLYKCRESSITLITPKHFSNLLHYDFKRRYRTFGVVLTNTCVVWILEQYRFPQQFQFSTAFGLTLADACIDCVRSAWRGIGLDPQGQQVESSRSMHDPMPRLRQG